MSTDVGEDWDICLRCGHDRNDFDDMINEDCECDCHQQLLKDVDADGEVNIIFEEYNIVANVHMDEKE